MFIYLYITLCCSLENIASKEYVDKQVSTKRLLDDLTYDDDKIALESELPSTEQVLVDITVENVNTHLSVDEQILLNIAKPIPVEIYITCDDLKSYVSVNVNNIIDSVNGHVKLKIFERNILKVN